MKIVKTAISIIVASGILAASTAFAGCDPQLYRLSKYSGFAGEKIKITGINFGNRKGKVMFDDWTKAEIVSWGKKKITILVPDVEVTEAHKVRVCDRNNDCTRSQKFFVKRTGRFNSLAKTAIGFCFLERDEAVVSSGPVTTSLILY